MLTVHRPSLNPTIHFHFSPQLTFSHNSLEYDAVLYIIYQIQNVKTYIRILEFFQYEWIFWIFKYGKNLQKYLSKLSFTFNMFLSSGTLSSGNEFVSAEFSCSSQHYHFLNVIVSTFFTSHSFLYLQTLKCPFREIRKPFPLEFWLAINGWRLLRPRVRTFDVLASVADAQFHMEEP